MNPDTTKALEHYAKRLRSENWRLGRTERTRQEQLASLLCPNAQRWHFLCVDRVEFSAVAPNEHGARQVLAAERPWISAILIGCSPAPLVSHSYLVEMSDTELREAKLMALLPYVLQGKPKAL